MYIIYEIYYDIEKHWKLVNDICFTTKEKAINYLLNGVKSYKEDKNGIYEIDGTDYFIAKLDVFD